MSSGKTIILGAGVSGLTAGMVTGYEVYEKNEVPGGVCTSYYMDTRNKKYYSRPHDQTYRFEVGGGHWTFGLGKQARAFLGGLCRLKKYARKSSVSIPGLKAYIPYPLQHHIRYFPQPLRKTINSQLKACQGNVSGGRTMAEWLQSNFGQALCRLFFFPFHELYTDGLFHSISFQDVYKTPALLPSNLSARRSLRKKAAGYNAEFVYPSGGLDRLISAMAGRARLFCGKEAVRIDTHAKKVLFSDASEVSYGKIISTLPLNSMLKLCGIRIDQPYAFTSVLEVNIGGKKGTRCPGQHWLYIPQSKNGFYRVGFYSNVDKTFLPKGKTASHVSIYVEKAYRGGVRLSEEEKKAAARRIVAELMAMKFISSVDVYDYTWIEVAYTWTYPHSSWKDQAIRALKDKGIIPLGRYGRWQFQGIAKSIEEALAVKSGGGA